MKPSARKPHLSPGLPRLSVLAAIVWLAYPAVAVADVAGQFQFVFGDVRVLAADGRERPAQKGQSVAEGESVVTSASGSVQIKMVDGGTIAVRPGSQMKLDTYRFSGKADGSERAAFSLLSGGLRAITGLIGKVNRQNYSIVTPTATIGIRGTDHEPTVVLPTSVGVEQRDPPGTYDRVNVGATALTNSAGATLINPNQVGFAGITGAPPVILPKIPNLYQAGPVPKPQLRAPEQEKKADSVASGTPASSSPSSTDPASATSDASDKVTAVSTTSARSGSASGEDIRVVPTTDTAALSAPVVSAALVATPVVALVPVSVLTGKDAGGTSVNVTAQTLTSSAGSITTIAPASASTLVASPSPIIIIEPARTYSAPLHFSLGFDGLTGSTGYLEYYADTSRGLSFTRDALGNLSSIKSTSSTFDDDYGHYNFSFYGYGGTRSITPSSSTLLTGYGSDATIGLSWGRWQGGQVTTGHQYPGVDVQGVSGLGAYVNDVFVIGATYSEPRELGGSSLHWITGTANFPSYLPKILTGTADYRLVGGTTPTDSAGNVGALTAALLSVNFTTQRANASVGFSLSGYAWTVAATDLILQRGGQFARGYCGNNCYTSVDITKNNIVQSSVSAYGEIHGSLLGSGLNSAALYYSVTEFPTTPALLDPITGQSFQTTQKNMIQGVAGLTGPRQDEATPYRLVATAGAASDTYGNYPYYGGYGGGLNGGEMASSQLLDNASGLQAFASDNVTYLTSVSPFPTAGFTDRATVKIGTAINRDVSSTLIDGTTIAWGRWEGGNIDIYSRDGSTKLGTVGNANTSIHWLTSSPLMGELNTIPLTGVATYTLAGGTSPTDTKGNVGTLGAVTLNADFTNQKVDAAVKVNFASPSNTAAFSIISTGMPISSSGAFSSTRNNYLNNAQTSVSCVGASCGTITSGQLDGKFIGVAAKGAALTYGVNTTTPVTSIAPGVSNSVTGLVVMKR